jgi:hypothetical protein
MQFSPLGLPKTYIPQGIFTVLPSIDSHWFTAIENIWLVSVVFSALGLLGFASIPVAFIASLYKLGYCESFGIMTFATHIPVLMIFVLCFTPCCRRFSFDELFFKMSDTAHNAGHALLALRLIVVSYYFNAGVMKLQIDGLAWLNTDLLAHIIYLMPFQTATTKFFPILDWLPLYRILSIFTISIEILSPLALLGKRVAIFFIVSWLMLHFGVIAFMGGHDVFLLQTPCLLVFYDGWGKVFKRKTKEKDEGSLSSLLP